MVNALNVKQNEGGPEKALGWDFLGYQCPYPKFWRFSGDFSFFFGMGFPTGKPSLGYWNYSQKKNVKTNFLPERFNS